MTVKENRKRWLAALRSGDYEQNRGRLRRNDKYCSLGVAVDLFGEGGWVPHSTVNDDGDTLYMYHTSVTNLEFSIGRNTREVLRLSTDDTTLAVSLNDEEHYTLTEIADHFEEKWAKTEALND